MSVVTAPPWWRIMLWSAGCQRQPGENRDDSLSSQMLHSEHTAAIADGDLAEEHSGHHTSPRKGLNGKVHCLCSSNPCVWIHSVLLQCHSLHVTVVAPVLPLRVSKWSRSELIYVVCSFLSQINEHICPNKNQNAVECCIFIWNTVLSLGKVPQSKVLCGRPFKKS